MILRNFLLGSFLWVGFSAAAVAQTEQPDVCDYSDSINHFGWGWDSTTQTSCVPDREMTVAEFVTLYEALDPGRSYDEIIAQLRTDYCDYSDAGSQGGWGWNNVLSESCTPLDKPPAPEIVGELRIPDQKFALALTVSSNSTLYTFEPSVGKLSATTNTGDPIWRVSVGNTFLQDMQLSVNEDLLIASALTNETIAYDILDGSIVWRAELTGIGVPPEIFVGDAAVIAFYKAASHSNVGSTVLSYNYDGTVRWQYRPGSKINDVTPGNDGLIYVRLPWDSVEELRYMVLKQ